MELSDDRTIYNITLEQYPTDKKSCVFSEIKKSKDEPRNVNELMKANWGGLPICNRSI